MRDKLITIFGGGGFLGRHITQHLTAAGARVRIAQRNIRIAQDVKPLGNLGQTQLIAADIRKPETVARAVHGADAVVNLVGILKGDFDAFHHQGAANVAQAAAAAGVQALVHVSAIGADAGSKSAYGRSKAEGEAAVLAAVPGAVILRPSIVFGPEDGFFNRFAALARVLPALPLVGGGETRFQPVFVGDVAEAVARGVDGVVAGGRVYELGGPEVKSFRELLAYICEVTDRKRLLVPLPFPVARIQARILELVDTLTLGLLPDAIKLTRDQVTLLESDNVVSAAALAEGRSFEGLCIAPVSVEAIVPSYLWRFRKAGQFDTARAD